VKTQLLPLILFVLSIQLPVVADISQEEIFSSPMAEIEAQLPSEHPGVYYLYAQRLFEEGRKDEAIFWFYAGQLRYLFYLEANPDLQEEASLFASLNLALNSINEYAAENPSQWIEQLDRVLAWDRETPNRFTSKEQFPMAWDTARSSIRNLKLEVDQIAEQIVQDRLNRQRGHTDEVEFTTFSPDGQQIISGGGRSDDNTVRIWDLQGNAIGEPFQGHTDDLYAMALSPDGQLIATGNSGTATVQLRNLQGEMIGEPFQGHTWTIIAVAFSPDGQTIASGSGDSTIRFWDLQGNPVGEPWQPQADNPVLSLAFSPDGQMIIAYGAEAQLQTQSDRGLIPLPNLNSPRLTATD